MPITSASQCWPFTSGPSTCIHWPREMVHRLILDAPCIQPLNHTSFVEFLNSPECTHAVPLCMLNEYHFSWLRTPCMLAFVQTLPCTKHDHLYKSCFVSYCQNVDGHLNFETPQPKRDHDLSTHIVPLRIPCVSQGIVHYLPTHWPPSIYMDIPMGACW